MDSRCTGTSVPVLIPPNMHTTVPPEVANALKNGEPAPAGLSAEETIAYEAFKNFAARGAGFRAMMGTRPQTIGYSLADSPVGLAAWFYEKFAEWTDTDGEPERALTKDEMLDDITLYWLTNTAASSARMYWEDSAHKTKVGGEVSIPAAVSRFPREIIPVPRSWAERAYPNLVYFNKLEKGGHFAAWEQPELFAGEMRAAFRSLRVGEMVAAHVTGAKMEQAHSYAQKWALLGYAQWLMQLVNVCLQALLLTVSLLSIAYQRNVFPIWIGVAVAVGGVVMLAVTGVGILATRQLAAVQLASITGRVQMAVGRSTLGSVARNRVLT